MGRGVRKMMGSNSSNSGKMTRSLLLSLLSLLLLMLMIVGNSDAFMMRSSSSSSSMGVIRSSNPKNDHDTNTNVRSSIPRRRIHDDVHEVCRMMIHNNNKEWEGMESVRRRQLVLSLLAGMAGGPLPATAASAVINGSGDEEKVVVSEVLRNNVMKAPLDEREYEYMVLKNGLRVMLCSDVTSTSAACAMAVHVGATSDPQDLPGLAHFCEHMLFLGTEKYPKEDDFEAFLNGNGGSSNAFTDSENTVYYFDTTNADTFGEAIDRFASFFAAPLFNDDAVGREMNAIDSEHSKNLQNDAFRLYQLDKSRLNSNHPYSRFFTGTLQTLKPINEQNTRQRLLQFYNTYYSANQMYMAITAPQSISTLKQMVLDSCLDIPNHNNPPPPEQSWNKLIPPYLPSNNNNNANSLIPSFHHYMKVVPVQDLRQVTVSFPIVYADIDSSWLQQHLTKPSFYAAHIIGHEGPNSLASFLKNKGWINELTAASDSQLSDFTTFEIVMDLTETGLDHVNDVVMYLFSYLQYLQTNKPVPSYIFQEVLNLSELDWRFFTKSTSTSHVQSLVRALYEGYPPQLAVAGPRRLALSERDNYDTLITSNKPRTAFDNSRQLQFAKDTLHQLTDQLTVDNAIVTLVSKTYQGQTDRKDQWYGTEYTYEPIPPNILHSWKHPPKATEYAMSYPSPNPFIPTERGLRVKRPIKSQQQQQQELLTMEQRLKPITPPHVIRDDDRWTVYFKPDDRFGQPKAYAIFQLLTNDVYSSPKNAVLSQLYQACTSDKLQEYAYDASLAGLTYDVSILPRGVRLTFGGYNDKLLNFSQYIATKLSKDIASLLPDNEQQFLRYKDNILRSLKAFDTSQSYAHAIYYSALTFQPTSSKYDNAQLRQALEEQVTLDDLTVYVQKLWSKGKVEALLQGNWDESDALQFVNVIDQTLAFQTLTDPQQQIPPRAKALKLPSTSITKIASAEPNKSNPNAASQLTIQCLGKTEKDHVLVEIISAVLNEPFYEELRTKQQLGYIVSSGVKALADTRNLSFVVQSSVAPVTKLTQSITSFLESAKTKYIEPLTDAKVEQYIKSIVLSRTEPDKLLATEASRNWNEIASGRLQFDRLQVESTVALELTKEDVMNFWDENYLGKSSTTDELQRRILICENSPESGPAFSPPPPRSFRNNNNNNNNNKKKNKPDSKATEVILGVDDIESFRQKRE